MCNETHNKLYFPGLTDVIELHKHIVYMPDNIIVFFYQSLYNIMRLVDL